MTLPLVSSGDPHVQAHNDERAAINRFYEDITDAIDEAIALHQPGVSLGYVEKLTPSSATATAFPGNEISGLSLTIMGTGRPVEVRFGCPSVTHSVANTNVSVNVRCNGNGVGLKAQFAGRSSPQVTTGQGNAFEMSRQIVLDEGILHTFTVACFSYGVAGTATLYAADYQPTFLSAVAR